MSEQDIKFEVEVMVSPWKVAKLARKAIGSPYAVLEPSRDIKLALNEIGVAEEVEVRKFEDGRLVVAPKAGVNALRINEIVRKISAELGRKISGPIIIEGIVFALLIVGIGWGLLLIWEWAYNKIPSKI